MHKHPSAYTRLAAMAVLSFICMYLLMYAMVNVWANVIPSLNQVYMAGLMTAPMIVIEMLFMGAMYPNKRWNLLIGMVSLLGGLMCFILIRQQVGINDQAFLRSMIPHHAGAILMCEKAQLEDPELKALCTTIIQGQQAEIDLMHAKLEANR